MVCQMVQEPHLPSALRWLCPAQGNLALKGLTMSLALHQEHDL